MTHRISKTLKDHWLLLLFLPVWPRPLSAQDLIRPRGLTIGANTTTNLVFPCDIRSVDRGSQDIRVQKAPGTENTLQLKAVKPGFTPTNLSVITLDGSLYSFLLSYSPDPDSLNLVFTDRRWQDLAPNLRGIHDRQDGISLSIRGIYIRGDCLLLKLECRNRSPIDYRLASLHCFMRDKRRLRRQAAQEILLHPLCLSGDQPYIPAGGTQVRILSLPLFTIPAGRRFGVELMEQNGGRHLLCTLNNQKLIKAQRIND